VLDYQHYIEYVIGINIPTEYELKTYI